MSIDTYWLRLTNDPGSQTILREGSKTKPNLTAYISGRWRGRGRRWNHREVAKGREWSERRGRAGSGGGGSNRVEAPWSLGRQRLLDEEEAHRGRAWDSWRARGRSDCSRHRGSQEWLASDFDEHDWIPFCSVPWLFVPGISSFLIAWWRRRVRWALNGLFGARIFSLQSIRTRRHSSRRTEHSWSRSVWLTSSQDVTTDFPGLGIWASSGLPAQPSPF